MSETGLQFSFYAVAIGSNRPLASGLDPKALVETAMDVLDTPPMSVVGKSALMQSQPVGPSQRRYVNAAVIVETTLSPPALLGRLQEIEDRYGRRRYRRWGARTLDLDIILWSGGIWSSGRLAIPHVAFRQRGFVLMPLAYLVPEWRDPVQRLTVKHLLARLQRRKPVDHEANPL